MYTTVFLVAVALPLLVASRPTHCERHKGDSQFRCAKDDYRADKIHIRNIADSSISFKVGKWYSKCGKAGVNYSYHGYSLGSGGSTHVEFNEASSGICNELFVYECKRNNVNVNCLDLVSVYPV